MLAPSAESLADPGHPLGRYAGHAELAVPVGRLQSVYEALVTAERRRPPR